MDLWPQFRSPLLWDFFAILAYVVSSVLFWYFGLVPDLATLRDRARTRGRQVFYGVLAAGFRGSGRQWRHHRAAYGAMAAIMAPMVISVHSIVGLDFAGAATPGWHSTQFPPFFVFGALLSGFAMVLLLAIPLRRLLRLENFITTRHIDVLGRLLVASSLAVGFAYAMDAFTVFYGSDPIERTQFIARLTGFYAPVYWATLVLNVALPQLLIFYRLRQCQPLVLGLSMGVIIGMWCERFDIVVISLHRTSMPSAWGNFGATFWDWATLFGTIGVFVAGMLLCVRLLPIISMYEMRGLLLRRPRADAS